MMANQMTDQEKDHAGDATTYDRSVSEVVADQGDTATWYVTPTPAGYVAWVSLGVADYYHIGAYPTAVEARKAARADHARVVFLLGG